MADEIENPRQTVPQTLPSISSYHASIDEEDDLADTSDVSARPYIEYSFHYTKRRTHLIICSASTPDKKPLYFAEMHEFTPKKTDVQLRRVPLDVSTVTEDGSSLTTKQGISGDVVGVAHFPSFSRDFKLGFGNPETIDETVVWEEIRNSQRVKHGRYDFSYTIPNQSCLMPVDYAWHRTHAVEDGLDDGSWKRKINMNCFKLVEVKSGDIVAIFQAPVLAKLSRVGTLRIFDGKEKDLELMILLSFCAIKEKARRRAWKRRVAAAAGGGGGGGGG